MMALIAGVGAAFVQSVLPVILIGGIGYTVGRARALDLASISGLAVSVFVPAVVFDSLAHCWRSTEWSASVLRGSPSSIGEDARGPGDHPVGRLPEYARCPRNRKRRAGVRGDMALNPGEHGVALRSPRAQHPAPGEGSTNVACRSYPSRSACS